MPKIGIQDMYLLDTHSINFIVYPKTFTSGTLQMNKESDTEMSAKISLFPFYPTAKVCEHLRQFPRQPNTPAWL